jgi:hypothetical protein
MGIIRRAAKLIIIPWKRTVLALLLFGTAFGYLEAAVVTYLRALHEPARQRFYPGRPPAELFPLLTLDQVRTAAPCQMQTLAIEIGREAATIVMLAAVALAVARNAGDWAAAFVITFAPGISPSTYSSRSYWTGQRRYSPVTSCS